MYKDTIKVANKIISDEDLSDIFQRMDEEIKENIKICNQETIQNERFEREYQHWTTKDFEGKFTCTFNFYDDTSVKVDNYNEFLSIFNNRLHEVKSMWIYYVFTYFIQDGKDTKYIHKKIDIDIHEEKMSIDFDLGSDDQKMVDIYELIKNKIYNAPEKYDRLIKKRSFIIGKVGFALGMIPSLIICTLLVFASPIRELYSSTYVLYPIIVSILAYVIGLFFTFRINNLYNPLLPEQKYVGWDSSSRKSIYKDDIDDYVSKSEIIIGNNINNIKNRKEISEIENKYSKFIPIELIVLLILSIIVIVIGKIAA